MSRKSRQSTAAQKLKHVAPPKIALFIAIVGLFLGTVMAIPVRITPKEEAVPIRAVLEDIQGVYRTRQGRRSSEYLHSIRLLFLDHDPLFIHTGLSTEDRLAELSAFPEGMTCEMLLPPDGTTILSLRIGGQEVLSYDDTAAALRHESSAKPFAALPFFAMGGYGLWSLLRCWQYRRVLHSHL